MISREDAEGLGFRIEFKTDADYHTDNFYRISWDAGETWKGKRHLYTDSNEILKHQLGRFYVICVLKPQLSKEEELCTQCAHKGEVGIVQYAGITTGIEKICVEKWHEDYNYTEDIEVYRRYAQWKCCKCGDIARSDYA